MSHQALARKPIEPPATRAAPALGHAEPVRALDETARRLNARPSLVAQRGLAARLGGGAPLQLMPRGFPGDKKEPEKKRKGTGNSKNKNKKTKTISRESSDIREVDSEHEEDRKDTSDIIPTLEIEEKKIESPRKKSSPKKVAKKKRTRKTIVRPPNLIGEEEKTESDYSDSEGEADKERIELAKKHGVVNFTKKSREKNKRIRKVRNKIDAKGLEEAKGKLNGDAKAIQSKATNRPGAVVVTTALLFHPETKLYKKFAFTNGKLMLPDLRTEAERLGYHVVKAPTTHAESQMIQYLYVRSPVYMHEDMGVDRDHCDECHILMASYFDKEDYGTHASKSKDVYKHYHAPSLLYKAVDKEEGQPISKYRDEKGELNEGGKIALSDSKKRRNKLRKQTKKSQIEQK